MRDIAIVIVLLVSVGAMLLVAAPTVSAFLVRARSRRLRSNCAIRLEEEWLAELKAIPNRASKLTFAIALTLTRRKAFGLPVEDLVTELQDRPHSVVSPLSGWKSLLIIPTAVFAVAAYGMSYLLPVRYASEALILVRPADVPAEAAPGLTRAVAVGQQLAAIRQVLLSRTNLVSVMRELNLYDSGKDNHTLSDRVQEIRDNISITSASEDGEDRHEAFTLRFVGPNPETVQQVTSKLVSLFIQQSNQIRETEVYSPVLYLQVQLDELAKRLTEQGRLLVREKTGQEQAGSSVNALQYEMLQSRYRTVFDRLEEARMTEYLETHQKGAQFVIVDPPFLPDRPIGPNRPAIAAVGALAGCVFGLIAMAGLSRRRRRLLA